jgi:hypothetical protein
MRGMRGIGKITVPMPNAQFISSTVNAFNA